MLGIDDGIFIPRAKGLVDIIGVVFRGGRWLDGVMRTEVDVDGIDATDKIASMILESSHYQQLRIVMLNGITFAGFNVVNAQKLYEKVNLPIIIITRDKPNFEEIRKALEGLPYFEERWKAIQSAGDVVEVRVKRDGKPIYMQTVGISEEEAEEIVRRTSTRSNIPEALRVAHIIASGLARFKGRGNI